MPAEACVMRAEAPSLTTYKDKSDEFSLSVPASESCTSHLCSIVHTDQELIACLLHTDCPSRLVGCTYCVLLQRS